MRIIRTVVKDCLRCPNSDHSGAFTKGGPWTVCHASELKDVPWGEIDYNDPEAGLKWAPPICTPTRREPYFPIPKWCPLDYYEEELNEPG